MKRPFAVVGISYLIAQTIAVLCGFAVTAVMLCIALLCALVVFLIYKDRPAWLIPVLLSCVLCFGMSVCHSQFKERPVRVLEGHTVLLTGRICEAPNESFGRFYYVIETESVFNEEMPQSVRFRLSSTKNLDAEYGDRITAEVSFNYSDRSSPSLRVLRADNVLLTGYLAYGEVPEISDGQPSLYGWIIGLREQFTSAAAELMGEELGGLLAGMFTGGTSGIDSVTLAQFRDCGLSHLFSVSGLHLSILTAALTILLRRITPNYRATALMCVPFVLFFMAFSGFSMSIRRAGIMTLLALAAAVVRREYDPLNSLGFAALVICLLNPCAAGDAGMLMSFASTAGIIVLYAPVSKRVRSFVRLDPKSRIAFVLRPALETLVTAVIAQVFTLPISVLCFGQISLTAPLANLLCIYPASMFMLVGALAAALYCIPLVGAAAGVVLMVPAWIAGRLCTVLTGLIALIPGSGLSVNYPFISIIFTVAAGLAVLWFLLYGKERNRKTLALCFALVLEMTLLSLCMYNGYMLFERRITVFGSDSGVMTALNSGGQCVVIGCGTDSYRGWLASEKLTEDNITGIRAIALPDNSAVYAEYAGEIIERYKPDAVFLSDEGSRYELISQSALKAGADMYLAEGASYSAEACGISFRMFSDSSGMMWTWADCAGLTMLISPEKGDCLLVPEEYRRPDVAVVCPEGMTNITILDPLAVIVCGADTASLNKAASLLEFRGVKNVFAVPDDKSITVSPDGHGINVLVE